MSEEFYDQVSRVEQMCEPGQQTWDLSRNDVAVLKVLLTDWKLLQNPFFRGADIPVCPEKQARMPAPLVLKQLPDSFAGPLINQRGVLVLASHNMCILETGHWRLLVGRKYVQQLQQRLSSSRVYLLQPSSAEHQDKE